MTLARVYLLTFKHDRLIDRFQDLLFVIETCGRSRLSNSSSNMQKMNELYIYIYFDKDSDG